VYESVVTNPEPELSGAYVATEFRMFKGAAVKEMGKVQPTTHG
jgi:hypothetical protein